MAENPYVNKVIYGNDVLIDLSEDTVTENTLKRGATAHTRSGEQITGELDVLPSGGSDGDVLVKAGATDYAGMWTNMPPLLGNIADLELTNTASRYYAANEYLMYNGKLYQTKISISEGGTLNPGDNGNLLETKVSDVFRVLKCTVRIAISAIPANGTKNNGVSIATPPPGYSFLFIIPQYSDKGYPVVSTWISDPWRANAAIYNPTSTAQDDAATVNLFFIRGIVTTQRY